MKAMCIPRVVLLFALACVGTIVSANAANALTIIDGLATCNGIGSQSVTLSSPIQNGTYSLDAGNSLYFQFYPDTDRIFFFTNATVPITGVLAYGGGKTAIWTMPDGGATGWPSLQAPDDDQGQPYALASVTFCFDYAIDLNPDAYQTVERHWRWDIEKTGPSAPLTLLPGQSQPASYFVTVTPTLSSDASYSVEGPVFVTNPTPYSTMIDAPTVTLQQMTDTDGNGVFDLQPSTVTCPVTFPYTLAPFTQLQCTFAASLPDEYDRLVITDIVHDGPQGVRRWIEQLIFGGETDIDGCVTVLDSRLTGSGQLGTACAAGGPKTFTYSMTIGPSTTAGSFVFGNTATVIGLHTATTFDTSTWNVAVTVQRPLPTSVDECKKGGWQAFGIFKNQGDCVSYVATGGKNTPAR